MMAYPSYIGQVVIVLIILLILTFCAGCTGQENGSDQVSVSSEANTIIIEDSLFNPETLTVTPGTTVTWKNTDTIPHVITSDDDSDLSFSSQELGNGENYSYTYDKRGIFGYHCSLHPTMKGTVIVQT